ncbi:MAG: YhfC family intramembrane metalloprotease [Lachnospiraceae bacterium]|nr:YhfC family intramembrane metalloprotease [Lachnospiraceae bacterium]
MSQTVSSAAMGGMVFSLCIAFLLPIALMIIAKIKLKPWFLSVIVGAGTFIAFAFILESILHSVVMMLTGDLLTNNLWFRAIYGGLAAGIFEETGRLVAFKTVMKKHLTKENSIMYGIGHGGIEAILILGTACISNLSTAAMINSGNIETLYSALTEPTLSATKAGVETLIATPALTFYLGGVERISAITLHICLSYIVYRAVKDKNIKLFILAIAIHAFIDAVTVFLASVTSALVLEIVLMAMVAVIAVFVAKAYKKEPATVEEVA